MAREVIWSKAAVRELDSAAQFIAEDSLRYADTLIADAELEATALANFPLRGRIVPEIGNPDVREIFVKAYRLIYSIQPTRVAIVGFVHGARDLTRFLR